MNIEKLPGVYNKLYNIQNKAISLVRNTKGYNYKYADLSQLLEAVQPHLSAEKLLVYYTINDDVLTMHIYDTTDGSSISSSVKLDAETKQQGAQAVGSLVTYFRRYLLIAALNIVVDDDDGAAASKRVVQPQQTASGHTYTSEDLQRMLEAIELLDSKVSKKSLWAYATSLGMLKGQYEGTYVCNSELSPEGYILWAANNK